ncbi:YegP family protein [Nocardia sp. NPDC055321]
MAGEFRWRLEAANGQITAQPQGYASKDSAKKGIASVQANAAGATRAPPPESRPRRRAEARCPGTDRFRDIVAVRGVGVRQARLGGWSLVATMGWGPGLSERRHPIQQAGLRSDSESGV